MFITDAHEPIQVNLILLVYYLASFNKKVINATMHLKLTSVSTSTV